MLCSGWAGLAAASASLAALEPLTLKALFDRFYARSALADAALPFAAFIGILIARELIALVQDRLFWRARLGISFALLSAMIDRLHALPLGFHRRDCALALPRNASSITSRDSSMLASS